MAKGMYPLTIQEQQELKTLDSLSQEQRDKQGKQNRYLTLKFRYFINLGKR